jgi:hypothetical protein
MNLLRFADAAYASNIPPGFAGVFGYYGGPRAYHVWPAADWARFPGLKVPVWVGGQDGPGEGLAAVETLHQLAVPAGSITALDMETRKDITYVEHFGAELAKAGYLVWVYGSLATVCENPPLNGYWIAAYGISYSRALSILSQPHVRAVQDQADVTPGYDDDLVKQWTEGEMWT